MKRLWEVFGPLLITSAILGAIFIPALMSRGNKPRKPTPEELACIDAGQNLITIRKVMELAAKDGDIPASELMMYPNPNLDEIFASCMGLKLEAIQAWREENR